MVGVIGMAEYRIVRCNAAYGPPPYPIDGSEGLPLGLSSSRRQVRSISLQRMMGG